MSLATLPTGREAQRPHRASPNPGLEPASKALTVCLAVVPGLALLSAWNPSPPGSAIVEMSAFVLTMVCLKRELRRPEPFHVSLLFLSAALIPVIGCVQLLALRIAYPFATMRAVVYWAAVAAMILAAEWLLRLRNARSLLLSSVAWIGVVATAMEILQIYRFRRYQVLETGYPLLSSNYYAEIIELILPVVLTRVFRNHRYWWAYLFLSCLFVSTVIAAAARVGSVLVLIECIVVSALSYKESQSMPRRWHKTCVILVLLATGLVVLQGPVTLIRRLGEADLMAGRLDIDRSAVAMARSRPILGYGLGSFPVVYPAFARFDNGYFVNHAHNDWLEALTEGGPALLVVLAVFVLIAGYSGVRATWGLGLAALPFHAAVDFPMQRAGVVLLYAVLAAAAGARRRQHRRGVSKWHYLRVSRWRISASKWH
jgi:O-antigen ligase